jgi:phosphotransferase system enzyme I (PtsI)
MSLALHGQGVSAGVALGQAYVLPHGQVSVSHYAITPGQAAAEVQRYEAAVHTAREQLRVIRGNIPRHAPPDVGAFIETHLLMLEDAALTSAPARIIREQLCNAEWALKLHTDSLLAVFDEMDDPYLRTRRDDVNHAVNRIQRLLAQTDDAIAAAAAAAPGGAPRIIIADDLSPADTITLQEQGVAAFITEQGGPLSHAAILARSLRIPAITGVRHATRLLLNGEELAVDGRNGVILAEAPAAVIAQYQLRQLEDARQRKALDGLASRAAITKDGRRVHLLANIELPEEARDARRHGADGVGLYRTEFLYMNRATPPDEEEQFHAYVSVVRAMKGQPVHIRTLDLGADKQPGGFSTGGAGATNPALGLRAVRLCMRDHSLFLPQLRALLRASGVGPVRIIIPMISSVGEWRQVQALVERVRASLKDSYPRLTPDIALGAMIEVPSAAIAADTLARECDFLSIGTNDLIQYTLAIDRVDESVSHLYDPLHPSVLALIAHTIRSGHKHGTPVAMCGEMAGDPRFTRLLLGMGLHEFSMQPSALPAVKDLVLKSRAGSLQAQVRRLLKQGDSSALNDWVERNQ